MSVGWTLISNESPLLFAMARSFTAYPDSLAPLQEELSGFHVSDPALPDKPLSYRLEKQGYLLWSAGPDAKDNDGDADTDWLWRIKHNPPL